MRSSVGSTLMWLRTTNTQYRGLHSEATFRICSRACPAPCTSKIVFVAWSRTCTSFWAHSPVFRGWKILSTYADALGRWNEPHASPNQISPARQSLKSSSQHAHAYIARTRLAGGITHDLSWEMRSRSCREFFSSLDANLSELMDFDDEYHK